MFALAVHSFTHWPVDAWAGVRDEKGRLRTFYWIQGNTLGQLIAHGDENSLDITGSVQLISNVTAVRIAAQVNQDDFLAGHGRRVITIEIDGGADIVVDAERSTGHLRERANAFIDALLTAVSNQPTGSDR